MTAHYLTILSVLVLTSLGQAQVTHADVVIGGPGTLGCQNSDDPPTLDNRTPASADLHFTYDAGSAELGVRVTNTSLVVPGEPNPVITVVGFNLPAFAVTGASLSSQTGSGGAQPQFAISFDPDTSGGSNPNRFNCFGSFSVMLNSGVHNAIANANADTLAVPPSSAVIGPVTFVLQLSGPGTSTLNARTIANAFSQGSSRQVNAAVKFQAAGPGGEGSGQISNGPECSPGLYAVGPTQIGQTFQLCAGGGRDCHGCVLVSLNPGPIQFGTFLLPIGLPILHTFVLPPFAQENVFCAPLTIPDQPWLRGLNLYFLLIVTNANGQILDHSDRLTIVIQ
jgi:hypothetical protein